MQRDGALSSLWQYRMPDYVPVHFIPPADVVDVVIVGGGITGISTALLLQKAGKSCVVAEAKTLCFGTSGGTTAHINTVLDHPYNEISSKFGEKNAQLLAQGALDAVALIRKNVMNYKIECEFEEQDGYIFSQNQKQTEELEKILQVSREVGIEMEYNSTIPFPIPFEKAVVFPDQAKFHPARYVFTLAEIFEESGGIILQNCRVTKIEEKEALEVMTSQGLIRAKQLIWATHIPPGINIIHFRCAPYRSYAMAIKLRNDEYPEGLAYDMDDPYHYYRTQEIEGEKYLIAGGEDHKTAHEENTNMCFTRLEAYLRKHFDIMSIPFKWSSQYFEPADGLPYIGHLPGHPERIYVATGFGGNGITYGTLAAITLSDMIVSGESQYQELFNPNRIKPIAGFANFVKENADVVGQFVKGKFSAEAIDSVGELAKGEAKLAKIENQTLAMYKDESGKLYAVNPTCPHAKCTVSFNMAEQSWDCPCHGSRFGVDGLLLTGPALHDLQEVSITTLVKSD